MPFIYILECADGSLYVGSTTHLPERIAQHQAGEGSKHTRRRLPVKLLWSAEIERRDEAFAFERRLHGWSRAKKLAFVRGEHDALRLRSGRSYAAERARREAAEPGSESLP